MQNFKPLGKLTKEQKEEKWATTISGSQAWELINEPYNLIRKKFGQEPIHQSKFDFFTSNDAMKARGTNAMANGTHYESWVFSEVKNFLPKAVSEDICFEPIFPEGHRMKPYEAYITATPDFLEYNEDRSIAVLGEIKCSTAAEDRAQMTERYYWQLLHNAYVMKAPQAQLWTKNELTKPVNSYIWNFTQADFDNYEEKLLEFFANWSTSNLSAYDSLSVEYGLEHDTDPALEDLFLGEDVNEILNTFIEAKINAKASNSIVAKVEKRLKEAWENPKSYDLGDNILEMSVVKRGTKLDTTSALNAIMQEYKVPQNFLDDFMTEAVTKSIKIKSKDE